MNDQHSRNHVLFLCFNCIAHFFGYSMIQAASTIEAQSAHARLVSTAAALSQRAVQAEHRFAVSQVGQRKFRILDAEIYVHLWWGHNHRHVTLDFWN